MKRPAAIIAILALILSFHSLQAQKAHKYWVQFSDKQGTPYTIANPSDYLSPRAIERRHKFGISIDSLDLPVNPAYVEAVASINGVQMLNTSKWMNGVTIILYDTSLTSTIAALPHVSDVTLYCIGLGPDIVSETHQGSDFFTRKNWNEEYSDEWYGYAYGQLQQMNGAALHRAGYTGSGVLIGVADGGFIRVNNMSCLRHIYDSSHFVAKRNFVEPGKSIYQYGDHGSMVLSCMAAFDPGLAVGTAPEASYALAVTEDPRSESPIEEFNWISAIEFFDSLGVDLVNTSLGYRNLGNSPFNYTDSMLDGHTPPSSRAAEIATAKGILIVVAAGNEGRDKLGAPGDAEHALTVGAVDEHSNYAHFSSYGTTGDGRSKPDVGARGENALMIVTNNLVSSANGTSFASPILCGMMACVMQRCPNLTPYQLCDSVRAWGSLADNPANNLGYGIPDFSKALNFEVGIEKMPETQPFKIIPNPSNGNVSLYTSESQPNATITVFNQQGKAIYSGSISAPLTERTLSVLPQGLYLLRITTPSITQTLKMIRK